MGQVTVRDVAAHAGVSTATVGPVLNDNPAVGTVTREHALRAVGELGYVDDVSPRRLRRHRTTVVGSIITSLHDGEQGWLVRGMVEHLDGLLVTSAPGTTAEGPEDRGDGSAARVGSPVLPPAQQSPSADAGGQAAGGYETQPRILPSSMAGDPGRQRRRAGRRAHLPTDQR